VAQTVAELLAMLKLEQISENRFVGGSPGRHAFTRVFGGQLFAQMLMAADGTVGDDRDVHSMHSYFLRPGDQHKPLEFEVSRGLDGRSFSNRHVVVRQSGKEICNLTASFAVDAKGPEFQYWAPKAAEPESLPPTLDLHDQYREVLSYVYGKEALEFRFEGDIAEVDPDRPGQWRVWFRLTDELPDRQVLHFAAVAYAADIFLIQTALRPHAVGWLDEVDFATIDYSMWFHRPFRLHGWNLLVFGAAMARDGRALSFGELFTPDRLALASMTQEGMTRFKPGRRADLQERIRRHKDR
jgi:acyl-CoA thioesterase II